MLLLSAQRVLAFAPRFNTAGKRDATGAFQPEARALVRLASKGSELVLVDNSKGMPTRRKELLSVIAARAGKGFTSVAFFCHGLRSSIQLGLRSLLAPQLAAAISNLTDGAQDVVVPLYCCSTGADHDGDALSAPGTGDQSFADKLRDALCAAGAAYCRVTAHSTVGHATMNPMVVFMDGMGSLHGGVGGYAPVTPGSINWRTWKRTLRLPSSTLRLRMPYMTPEAIHAELSWVA